MSAPTVKPVPSAASASWACSSAMGALSPEAVDGSTPASWEQAARVSVIDVTRGRSKDRNFMWMVAQRGSWTGGPKSSQMMSVAAAKKTKRARHVRSSACRAHWCPGSEGSVVEDDVGDQAGGHG